jgi:hypothetical protein
MEIKPECPLACIGRNSIRIKQGISKQSAVDMRESFWLTASVISPPCMFIKSLQIVFIGLFLCIASACTTEQKQGKHMVWVPAETGSHLGGRWVEGDESAKPPPGTLNV